MTAVSDVLAFATRHPDYWGELFDTTRDLPPELTEDEVEAVTAAIDHIGDALEELLHLTGRRLGELYDGPGELRVPRFRPSKTRQNHRVQIDPPSTLRGSMYRIQFSLEASWEGDRIQLFPALAIKKGSLDDVLRRLDGHGLEHVHDGEYDIFGPGLDLNEGADFGPLADAAAGWARDALTILAG